MLEDPVTPRVVELLRELAIEHPEWAVQDAARHLSALGYPIEISQLVAPWQRALQGEAGIASRRLDDSWYFWLVNQGWGKRIAVGVFGLAAVWALYSYVF